jgi:hypothetical protein
VDATATGSGSASTIPPIFAAYCTVDRPDASEGAQRYHDVAVVRLLTEHTNPQPWWLGYLEIGVGAEEVVFHDAPRVTVYEDWRYVLVEAGPDQALSWRDSEGSGAAWKGALPELMFPFDRSWLWSTPWDDAHSSLGATEQLVAAFTRDATVGGGTRRMRARAAESLSSTQSLFVRRRGTGS